MYEKKTDFQKGWIGPDISINIETLYKKTCKKNGICFKD